MNPPLAPAKPPPVKSFAEGTSLFEVPLIGGGGALTAAAAGGNTTPFTPIAKSGFLAKLRYYLSGTLTVGTLGTAYTVPLWRIVQNYTLQNSLNYPYRSLNGDDIREWARVTAPAGPFDPIINSVRFQNPDVTSVGVKNWAFGWEDNIAQNDGVNFQRYLLSAMTTSNDLTVLITWLATANLAQLEANTTVFSALAATCAVSAEYLTVPDPTKYAWPRRNLVQQVLGDPSFNTPAASGINVVNLTPIQGPEFTGLGIQVKSSGGTPDTLVPGTSGISEIDVYVNGTIPLKQFTLTDLLDKYEHLFMRSPVNGYLYLDLSSDLSIPNVMSHLHRKVLSTSKYSQISIRVTTNANFTAGAGAVINLLKRTQQTYANNQ